MALTRRTLSHGAVAAALLGTRSADAAPQTPALPIAVNDLPPPKLAWERMLDIPLRPERSDERPDPLGEVIVLAPRFDGGALIVSYDPSAAATGGLRLLAIDVAGGTMFDVPISNPAGPASGTITTNSVALSAEAPGTIWLFHTWRLPTRPDVDEGPAASRLLAFDATGHETMTTRLPERIANDRVLAPQRQARVLRRMPDGSLLAAGTAWYGPPIWWFARFTTSGKLLHEQSSRGFPDYIEDVRGNADGGFSLLMVDAEDRHEKVTVRRYGADGRLAARFPEPELPQSINCAVSLGPQRQMRVLPIEADGERSKAEIVWHEAGRGIVGRYPLGSLGCDDLQRNGEAVLMMGADLPIQDEAPPIFVGFLGEKPLWRRAEASLATGAPAADGGAVILSVGKDGDKERMKLARYKLP